VIKTERIGGNALKITAPQKLQAGDFPQITPEVDSLIAKCGNIRLLIDASRLDGWASVEAAEKHMQFVKEHQNKVERIAVIVQHEWQHWFVTAVKVFLHPQIRAFDKGQEAIAAQWLTQ